MPLLEISQIGSICASVRLDEVTAAQVDQYAAFVHVSADDVVEKAMNYVFSKDRDFQNFLNTPQAKQVASTLRVRKGPSNGTAESLEGKLVASGGVHDFCSGSRDVIEHSISGWSKNAVLRTGRMVDTSPPNWELRATERALRSLRRLTFAAPTDWVNRPSGAVASDSVGS